MRDLGSITRLAKPGLILDSLSIYGSQVAALVLQFLTGIVLARALGPEGRGAYAVIILLPSTIVAIGGFGQATINAHLAAREPHRLRGLFANSLLLVAVVGTAQAVIGGLVLSRGWAFLQGTPETLVLVGCAAVPLLLLSNYFEGLLIGIGRTAERNRIRVISASVLLLLVLGLFLLSRMSLAGVVVAFVVQALITASAFVIVARRAVREPWTLDLGLLRLSLRHGVRAAATPACTFLLLRSDLFLINYFVGPEYVGYYAVAVGLANLLLMFPTSVGMAFLPRVSRRDGGSQRKLSPQVCRMTLWLTVALALVLAAAASTLIRAMYGTAFMPSLAPLILLLPGVVLASASMVLGSDIQGRGRFHVGSIASAIGLVVNIALNLVCIPRWGAAGAAISSSVAYGVSTAILLVTVARAADVSWLDLLAPRIDDWRMLATQARAGLQGRP